MNVVTNIFSGRKKFNFQAGPLQIVLEEDGTLIDDDEFLPELPKLTCFVILQSGETWATRVIQGKYYSDVLFPTPTGCLFSWLVSTTYQDAMALF